MSNFANHPQNGPPNLAPMSEETPLHRNAARLVRQLQALHRNAARLVRQLQDAEQAAWQQGYHRGVQDERTSEENIGIAGFGAKVEPARINPYLSQQPSAVDAHELWAAAQLAPGEGIEDGVRRIENILHHTSTQLAAMDEAAAIHAFEEYFQANSDDPYFESELKLWLTAWRKAHAEILARAYQSSSIRYEHELKGWIERGRTEEEKAAALKWLEDMRDGVQHEEESK